MRSVKIASIALAFAAVSFAGAAYAFQDSDVTVAYADGYMGTDNQFHPWEHRADAEEYRSKHADNYRAWRHDDPRHKDEH
jgi:hypothetical protein